MTDLIEFVKQLTDIKAISSFVAAYGGLYIVALIIFAETGLFVGFFLPGDSLLFASGIFIKQSPNPFGNDFLNLIYWIVLIAIAGVIGNMVGYWFGNKTGHLIFERKDTWLFKKKHIQDAHDFYEKKGGVAIILARFLPIVRTFAPIVAGVVDMDKKKFLSYNIIGSFLWVATMTIPGYFLGSIPWVEHNFEKIVIGMILVTTGPVLFKMFFSKKKTTVSTEA
ncbi:MAG: VTT domain-containing protein [Phycisphaerales bacterium]|nr:VTT domain-containing protein [Phycisphaerales bacterium]